MSDATARFDRWVISLGGYGSDRFRALRDEALEFAGSGGYSDYMVMAWAIDESWRPGEALAEFIASGNVGQPLDLIGDGRNRAASAVELADRPPGTPQLAASRIKYSWDDLAAVIELVSRPKVAVDMTGDGHGRHIPGTPYVYRHGFVPIDGTELGEDGIRRPSAGRAAASRTTKAAKSPVLKQIKDPVVSTDTAAIVKAAAAKSAAVKLAKVRAARAAESKAEALKANDPKAVAVSAPDPNAVKLVDQLNMMSSLGGKSTQKAILRKTSLYDLHGMDAEYTRRAMETGNISGGHKLVKEEIESRGGTSLPTPSADDLAAGKAEAKARAAMPKSAEEERQDLIGAWSTSYRYKGTTESKDKRTKDFAAEMHRLLSTNKQPKTCGPGCQDAHKFLGMVDKESEPQDKELTRGLNLTAAAAARMFKPGKSLDMPVSSWTSDDHTAANFAKGESKPGKVKVVLHAASGAKGLDISKQSAWENEHEVVSGGRFSVDKLETTGGVMNVYLTQKDFSAH